MSSKFSRVTVDHDEIRRWVESHGGHPASVEGTGNKRAAGLLRIDFDFNGKEEHLDEITWDQFFEKFDEKNLAFIYQEKMRDGSDSHFFKFVDRSHVKPGELEEQNAIEKTQVSRLDSTDIIQQLNQVIEKGLQSLTACDEAFMSIEDDHVRDTLHAYFDAVEEQILDLQSLVYGYGGEPTTA